MPQYFDDPIYAVARKKTKRFLDAHGDAPLDSAGVHELRVLTKKLRAYIRLYPNSSFYGVKRTDHALKTMARAFAGDRDATVKRDTLERVAECDPRLLAQSRSLLSRWRRQERKSSSNQIAQGDGSILLEILHHWPNREVREKCVAKALRTRFKKTGKRGERALRLVPETGYKKCGSEAERLADEKLHKFRKWSKYHLYGLNAFAGEPGKKTRKKLEKLNSRLGDYNDLCVLQHSLCDRQQTGSVDAAVIHDLLKRLAACKKADLAKIEKYYKKLYANKSDKHIKIN